MGTQQVIPLLPFGYATESVDQVSSRPRKGKDGVSVVRCQTRVHERDHGEDRFAGRAGQGSPRRRRGSSTCTSGGTGHRRDGRHRAELSEPVVALAVHGGRRGVRDRRALDDGAARPGCSATRRRSGGCWRPGIPAQAKKAGRLVRGFDEAVWERERFADRRRGQRPQVRRASRAAGVPAGHGRPGAGGGQPAWTGSGASASPRTTSAAVGPARGGGARTCWASR